MFAFQKELFSTDILGMLFVIIMYNVVFSVHSGFFGPVIPQFYYV